jgi:membrane-associated phospholipid phosphatase
MTASAAAFGSKTENVAFPVRVPLVLARGRPSSGLHRDGLPDGEHGATLLVLCVGGRYLRRCGLIMTAAAGAVVVIVFSLARVVTGAHWPSDVLGDSATPDKSFPASL